MTSGTIEIDTGKIRKLVPQLKRDVTNTLTLGRIDLEELDATYFHIAALVIGLGLANYIAYVVGTLLRLKILTALLSILFSLTPIMGFFYLLVYAYISGSVYAFMLSEDHADLKNYMYIALLGGVHLPFAIVLVNFTEGILKGLFGSFFTLFFFVCFGALGLFSDYFCRTNLTNGRHFEGSTQKLHFTVVSLVLNMGAYLAIFPLLYVH